MAATIMAVGWQQHRQWQCDGSNSRLHSMMAMSFSTLKLYLLPLKLYLLLLLKLSLLLLLNLYLLLPLKLYLLPLNLYLLPLLKLYLLLLHFALRSPLLSLGQLLNLLTSLSSLHLFTTNTPQSVMQSCMGGP